MNRRTFVMVLKEGASIEERVSVVRGGEHGVQSVGLGDIENEMRVPRREVLGAAAGFGLGFASRTRVCGGEGPACCSQASTAVARRGDNGGSYASCPRQRQQQRSAPEAGVVERPVRSWPAYRAAVRANKGLEGMRSWRGRQFRGATGQAASGEGVCCGKSVIVGVSCPFAATRRIPSWPSVPEKRAEDRSGSQRRRDPSFIPALQWQRHSRGRDDER